MRCVTALPVVVRPLTEPEKSAGHREMPPVNPWMTDERKQKNK